MDWISVSLIRELPDSSVDLALLLISQEMADFTFWVKNLFNGGRLKETTTPAWRWYVWLNDGAFILPPLASQGGGTFLPKSHVLIF